MRLQLTLFMALLCFQQLCAEHCGCLKGRLIDKNTKQPIGGANVYLLHTNRGTITDSEGMYHISNVPEDIYNLRIDHIKYRSYIEPEVRIVRNKTTMVKEIQLSERVLEFEEIEVSTDFFQDFSEISVSAFHYSREEIRRNPGSGGDIFRAIETMPGVSTSGGEFSSFSVRGGAPGDNIILIDNIPFESVSHFTNIGGNEDETIQGGRYSIFTAGLFEDADFQAGGFSAKYGGKNSSILNLKLKEGNREDFRINGTYDLIGWEINYDGPVHFHDHTGAIVSARHQDFDKIFEVIGEEGDGSHSFSDYLFKTSSDIHKNHKLSLLGVLSTEKSRRTIDHIYKDEEEPSSGVYQFDEDKWLGGMNWRFLTSRKSFFHSSLYAQKLKREYVTGTACIYDNQGQLKPKEQVQVRFPVDFFKKNQTLVGMKSSFYYQLSNNSSLDTGFELRNLKSQINNKLYEADTLYVFGRNDFRPDASQKYIIAEPSQFNSSLDDERTEAVFFTELSMRVKDRLTTISGIRTEHDNLSDETCFSPRLSASLYLNPRICLNIAAGHYCQLPDMEIIAANPENKRLKSEKADHVVFGMKSLLNSGLQLNIECYYKKYNDLVVIPDRSSPLANNDGYGWVYGIDFSLIKRLTNKFYYQLNYSYSQSKRNDDNLYGWYYSDFHQPHILNILGGYQFNSRWSVSAKWRFASGRPTDSYIIHQDVLTDPDNPRYSLEYLGMNDRRFGNFHSLNVRVDYRRQFHTHFAVIAFLDILNFYNHENENIAEFNEYTGKLDSIGLSMLPTFGFKFEF